MRYEHDLRRPQLAEVLQELLLTRREHVGGGLVEQSYP
jgi:hypothetical protein